MAQSGNKSKVFSSPMLLTSLPGQCDLYQHQLAHYWGAAKRSRWSEDRKRKSNWLGSDGDFILQKVLEMTSRFYQSAEPPPTPGSKACRLQAEHPTSPALGFITWCPLAVC